MMWRRLEDFYHSFVNLCKNTTNTTICYIFCDDSHVSAYIQCVIRLYKTTNDKYFFRILKFHDKNITKKKNNHLTQTTKNVSHMFNSYLLNKILIRKYVDIMSVPINFSHNTNSWENFNGFLFMAIKLNILCNTLVQII